MTASAAPDPLATKQERALLRRVLAGHGYNRRPLFMLRRALVARLGVTAGFTAWMQAVPRDLAPPTGSLSRLPLTALGDAVSEATLASGGRQLQAAPAKVLGDGTHRTLRITGRTIHAGRLSDAQVIGASGAVVAQDRAILDFEGAEIAQTDDAIELDPAIVAHDAAAGRVWTPAPREPLPEIASGFGLLGWSTGLFGHWLGEYLPKFMLAVARDAVPQAHLLIDAEMPAAHRQAIEMLAPDHMTLHPVPRFAPLRVRDLGLVSTLNYPVLAPQSDMATWDYGVIDADLFAESVAVMRRRLDRLPPGVAGPRRLYLSRRGQARRALVNTDEIEDLVRAAGFAVVQPEMLEFARQVQLMRGADVILGPDGSAMMLAMFARPGTRMGILNHPNIEGLATLTAPLAAVGIETTVLTGAPEGGDPRFAHNASYRIDPERLRAFLADDLV
ncbi:MAG: glycosyltransferase family 61 protein [Pseudomonadota bacterium]